jgi:HEPN domain-containing protein
VSAELQIASLLRIAAEDLRGARVLAASSNRNAIYLCSQAAEKVIRAVLTSEGKHAGIRHLLREMVDAIPEENPLKPALRAIESLGAWATSFRYPTSGGRILAAPTAAEFEKHAIAVEAALASAASAFGVDFAGTGPAARAAPLR